MPHEVSNDMRQCIENCTSCHAICTETAAHCLGMGGDHASPHHIHLLLDCAQTCAVSADFMLRGSELHPRVCGVCAEACTRCAEDCERLAGDDALMQRCAAMCRTCADSCGAMSKMS